MNTTHIAAQLVATPSILRRQLSWTEPGLLRWRPKKNDWCVKEIIGHLIEADRHAFAGRIHTMIAEDAPELPSVDVDAIAAQRRDDAQNVFDLLDELETQRAAYAEMVQSLTAEQMGRPGVMAKHGRFLVSDFVQEWAYHDHSHLMQIYDILQQHIWPDFSKTMQKALRSSGAA